MIGALKHLTTQYLNELNTIIDTNYVIQEKPIS